MCIRLITILFVLFSVSASSTVLAKERAKKGSRTPYRGLFPSPPLFDRMPTYRTQGKRSLNFLSARSWNARSIAPTARRWLRGSAPPIRHPNSASRGSAS